MLDDPHYSRSDPGRSVCRNLDWRFCDSAVSAGGEPNHEKTGRHRCHRLLVLRVNTLVARTIAYCSGSGTPTTTPFLDSRFF
jgi:hypothetical protein